MAPKKARTASVARTQAKTTGLTLDNLGRMMADGFTELGTDMREGFRELDERIDELDERLSGQLAEVDERLSGQIRALDDRVRALHATVLEGQQDYHKLVLRIENIELKMFGAIQEP